MSVLAERLALAAVRQMRPNGCDIDDALVPIAYSSYYQPVVDVIRAALDEAATVAREHEIVLDDGPFAQWTTKGGRFAQEIAAAIEALK